MPSYSGTIIADGIVNPTEMYRPNAINNNVIVFGTVGSGKTRSIVKPNLLQMDSSYVVTDPKGNLIKEVGPVLKQAGYQIQCLNLCNPVKSMRWNPFDLAETSQDLVSISNSLIYSDGKSNDPFWDHASSNLLVALASFSRAFNGKASFRDILHWLDFYALPPINRDGYSNRLDETITTWALGKRTSLSDPEPSDLEERQMVLRRWKAFTALAKAQETIACVVGEVDAHLSRINLPELLDLLDGGEDAIDIRALATRKTALFVVVSDTDPSLDFLVSIFYRQLFKELCRIADEECDANHNRLPVPVRVILDDFANQAQIPDFAKGIASYRSRDIWVMPICQAMSQLENHYGQSAQTIISCCDTVVYLGVNDTRTAQELSARTDIPLEQIQSLPIGEALVFVRGQKWRRAKLYDLTTHPNYRFLPEAREQKQEPRPGKRR